MNASPTPGYRPTPGDRVGIAIFMIAGVAIVAWSGIAAAGRIMQVLLGESIPATARFIGVRIEVPIGPDDSNVPMLLDSATVTATHLSPAGFTAAIIAAVLGFGTIVTVVACLMLLARNTLRGRIFGRSNTRLFTAAGMTALVGFGLAPVFDGMVSNDIVSKLADDDFHGYAVLTAEPLPFVLLAFAFGIVATAYTVGSRLQRDTEGLV